jgi:phosphoribosylformylglycinamidine synthase
LGTLVRAALACHDFSIAFKTPFISGKDSLHNEFSYTDTDGNRQTISIPATLLISALGQVPDIEKCVTMDFKSVGNLIYQIGHTGNHLGGSHWALVNQISAGEVPQVDAVKARQIFECVHDAILSGLIRSCHDLSEGGLAVAVAEMAFAGGWGAALQLDAIPLLDTDSENSSLVRLFSESNSRFVVEVAPEQQTQFESACEGIDCYRIGVVTDSAQLVVDEDSKRLIDVAVADLKQAWRSPLDWS